MSYCIYMIDINDFDLVLGLDEVIDKFDDYM